MASPSATRSRMLPSDRPVKTRATISPVRMRSSTASSDARACWRTAGSRSTFSSSNGASRFLTAGSALAPRALTPASRAAGSGSFRLARACASTSSALICRSGSFSSARERSGATSSLAVAASSVHQEDPAPRSLEPLLRERLQEPRDGRIPTLDELTDGRELLVGVLRREPRHRRGIDGGVGGGACPTCEEEEDLAQSAHGRPACGPAEVAGPRLTRSHVLLALVARDERAPRLGAAVRLRLPHHVERSEEH